MADTSSPQATVLMPVYNGERYLREGVESILRQTYRDWELLIVNDGSTDASREIALSYHARDARIRVLDNPGNRGLPWTLNRGLREARAPWIIRADSDDLNEPERIAAQMQLAAQNSLDVCFCDTIYVYPDGGERIVNCSDYSWAARRWLGLFGNFYGAHPAACLRKDAILALGGYDESFPCAQDYDLWDRCAAAGLKFGYAPRALARHRMHGESQSGKHLELQEAMARRVSHRALRRVWPELTEEAMDSLRWLFEGMEPSVAGRSHAPGLQSCGELMQRFFSSAQTTRDQEREIWALAAAHLKLRIGKTVGLGDAFYIAARWLQAKFKATW
ncbi:MAG: glycosyltransferase family A protein [Candidatus Sumerlaeota bacterium]|nr:glycosyltransferase family A protein [Candidatus Sumerlaeota bacterium]